MSEEKEKKPNEPQQAEEAKQKDSDLQAPVNRLKQENEEQKKKADRREERAKEGFTKFLHKLAGRPAAVRRRDGMIWKRLHSEAVLQKNRKHLR